MKKIISLLLTIVLFGVTSTNAQIKSHLLKLKNTNPTPYKTEDLKPVKKPVSGIPPASRNLFTNSIFDFKNLQPLAPLASGKNDFQVTAVAENGMPLCIKGEMNNDAGKHISPEAQCFSYLNAVKTDLRLQNPTEEFELVNVENDEAGQSHFRMQQTFQGVKVYNSELILHAKSGNIFMVNGRTFPTPSLPSIQPQLSENQIIALAINEVGKVKKLTEFEMSLLPSRQIEAELVIYHVGEKLDGERLAWHVTIYPNVASRWELILDAATGEVLQKFEHICKLYHFHGKEKCGGNANSSISKTFEDKEIAANFLADGPRTANATDLLGTTRSINTYESGSFFYLMDASRDMFNATTSRFPDDPSGVVWTVDAKNTSPENTNFSADHIRSSNNTWSSRGAVSAHYNGGEAFKYFRTIHGRKSINDRNGNILSFINIVEPDGSGMDNAFWNGSAIFYGNGNFAFRPLARGLDVAAHEMAHGVVQTTANLEYQGESGALNESFADIFGAMVDRDDWNIGEDVALTAYFPTGIMRSMSNPHNGGNSFDDPGYQPQFYSERYTDSDDNGGVHINSGIVNHAFYLFANNANVGKDKAEKVYYQALTKYLVRSSKFVDLRIAVVQAATDLYGANSAVVNAAKSALDAVGIPGGSGGNYQNNLPTNPGTPLLLLTDIDQSGIYLSSANGTVQNNGNPILPTEILSRPSITDNGSYGVFIGADKKMYDINFVAGTSEVIQDEPIWRNVAIAKDGSKLAALTDDFDNIISVYDYDSGRWKDFELYNPTFSTGATTGDIQYADVLEWDFDGEWVMYDALNRLKSTFGDIDYWDIGFMQVWNNQTNRFTNSAIVEKLYNGLPENTSVGNPTFAKNSPYIIAFDYVDEFNEIYHLVGANLQTGDVSDPSIFQNSDWNYPNYSVDDARMTFDAKTTGGDQILAVVPIATNKISASGQATGFISGGSWGVWFANGNRVFTDVEEVSSDKVSVFPNPFSDILNIQLVENQSDKFELKIFDPLGNVVFEQENWSDSAPVDFTHLPKGAYLVRLSNENGIFTKQVVKQ